MDHPNARSLYQRPVPRVGGLAMMVGIMATALFIPLGTWTWLAPALILTAVSLLDD